MAEKNALSTSDASQPTPADKPVEHDPEKTPASEPASKPAAAAPIDLNGRVTTPLPYPLPHCQPEPQPTVAEEHAKKYDELLATVSTWTTVPKTSGRNAETEPLTDADRLWLTRECLLRYLRATKWNVPEAARRLLATLTWRREYGLLNFTPEYISPENETGKQMIVGFDNDARPCLYLNPSKQNTDVSDRQLHHLFYMMERVIDLMGPGQETTALLINFKETSSRKNPGVMQGKQTLNILQGHYPERLGRALISELPWYVTTFFKLISPFIDPVTKTKMKFNEPLTDHVPTSHLVKHCGGKLDFEYDHSIYWPALNALCEARRRDYTVRWEKAGKKIGESESYLRGGEAKCLSGEYAGTDFPEGFAQTK
ncbi:CRAL/TRIO domain-containing protein [Trichodelitschia bisporula]|uniref:CRAL/TRIO domain-containing protein n=1 Tax=Trichodelitschia bisporula TaxID=703511 RepID=A0A6G1HSD0_9PEZI|nr:CRAL/TRIO domain-containing protein [Trichodelitschia bisporula]